jgi:hypothetical protein
VVGDVVDQIGDPIHVPRACFFDVAPQLVQLGTGRQ